MEKPLSKFFREAAECYLEKLGASRRNFTLDPAKVAKAYSHMSAIRRYATELEKIMANINANIKKECD